VCIKAAHFARISTRFQKGIIGGANANDSSSDKAHRRGDVRKPLTGQCFADGSTAIQQIPRDSLSRPEVPLTMPAWTLVYGTPGMRPTSTDNLRTKFR
jgi:hypothetical protein